jgi:flagellar biosynthesis/type III secretory pathway protein FliH
MGALVMRGMADNVIKARSAGDISPVFGLGQSEATPAAILPPDDPGQAEVERLERRIAALETEAAAHEALVKSAYDEGFAKGQDDAEADFEDSREQALEALKAGLADADVALKMTLERVEDHALRLAAEALEKLMGDGDSYRHILGSAIRQQVTQLGEAAVLSISVSRSDFPDSREILQAVPTLSAFESRMAVSDDLAAGRCDIRLLVGSAEIDIRRTWAEIQQILAEREAGQDNVAS